MIYYICAVVLVLLIILYRLERYNRTRNLSQDQTQQPEPAVPAGECCGKHAVCEKQKLAEARLRSAQYFDDEDLDRFKGRSRIHRPGGRGVPVRDVYHAAARGPGMDGMPPGQGD